MNADNENLAPFPLSPMDDRKSASHLTSAHARVEINGETFLLRAFNGLVFVREASRNDANWTWVLLQNPPPNLDNASANGFSVGASQTAFVPDADDLAAFFINHWPRVGQTWAKKVARVVVFHDNDSDRPYPLFFGAGGRGFVREPWNRDDLWFDWPEPQDSHAMVKNGDIETFRKLAQSVFREQLWPVLGNWSEQSTAQTYNYVPTEFLCGSHESLEAVLRLIVFSDPLLSQSQTPIKICLNAENAYTRAGLQNIQSSNFSAEWSMDWQNFSPENTKYVWEPQMPSPRLVKLVELALDENTPIGMSWEYSDQFSGRMSDTPESPEIEFEFDPPSQHEKIEALAQLREWLHGKIPDAEIEKLLAYSPSP